MEAFFFSYLLFLDSLFDMELPNITMYLPNHSALNFVPNLELQILVIILQPVNKLLFPQRFQCKAI